MTTSTYDDVIYMPPSDDMLPAPCHGPAAEVRQARLVWLKARDAATKADLLAGNADKDHRAALTDAARRGLDPNTVKDERAAKAATAATRREAAAAARQVAEAAWQRCLQSLREHRDEFVANVTGPALDAQAAAQQALTGYLQAREKMDEALALREWALGVVTPKPDGKHHHVTQGPKSSIRNQIDYPGGSLPVPTLLQVLAADCAAVEEQDRRRERSTHRLPK